MEKVTHYILKVEGKIFYSGPLEEMARKIAEKRGLPEDRIEKQEVEKGKISLWDVLSFRLYKYLSRPNHINARN